MQEQESQQPTVTITDKQASDTVSIILNAIESGHAVTEGDSLRLKSSRLSYLDRIILLAGGSLTLVFTVVANLSVQLHASHTSAHHPAYVAVSCWLLVSCIVFGLLASAVTLDTQRRENARMAAVHLDSKIKRAIIERNPSVDLSKLTGLFADSFEGSTDVKKHSIISRLCATTAQASLIAAFIFLAMFVQVNLPLLLTGGK